MRALLSLRSYRLCRLNSSLRFSKTDLRSFTTQSPQLSNFTSSSSSTTNTISDAEIAHFSALSAHWWDPRGEFGLLHKMNPSRVQFLRDSILRLEEVPPTRWLENRDVLDVGCGGGIFAESLARLGAKTLAIDASASNIKTAQTHAAQDPSFASVMVEGDSQNSSRTTKSMHSNDLKYRHCAAEDLVKEGKQFDIVCAMEVIEHVEDPKGFLDCLGDLTKPGGLLLLSTISRTPLAGFLTLTMAENVLRIVTPGTHTFSKFIKPEELQEYFDEKGWYGMERRGCIYDPLKGSWRLLAMGEWGGLGEKVNYFAGVQKPIT